MINNPDQVLKKMKWARRLVLIGGLSLSGLLNSIQNGFTQGIAVVFEVGALIGWGVMLVLDKKKIKNSPELSEFIQTKMKAKAAAISEANQIKSVSAKYEVGLEKYVLHGNYTISSAKNGLSLKSALAKSEILIPYSELIEVEAGSEDELRSRVTVSRVLLTGIFALGLKKEKKKKFYISIATANSMGLFVLNNAGANNRENESKASIFAAACNARIRQDNPQLKSSSTIASKDTYTDLEKLAELHERGVITQKEFEAKKKKILDI